MFFTLHSLGYTLFEIDEMTIGTMKDILIEYMNSKSTGNKGNKEKSTSSWRWATQEDFDRL